MLGAKESVKSTSMITNLDRYRKDVDRLLQTGTTLAAALYYMCSPEEFEETVRKHRGDKTKDYLKGLPKFGTAYQSWYSEAKSLIRQLLPERLNDFVGHYETPKARKVLDYANYRIEDCLIGLVSGNVRQDGAINHFQQQVEILRSVLRRFESSLFDIKQLVQADLFDSELDAAKELLRQKFVRAAGALAGVVLEKHLGQVCENHDVKVGKKEPTISDLNDALKTAGVLQVPEWRNIQHLGDIRNLCDHNKKAEPTVEQVNDLITGVTKVTKTLF